LAHWWRFGTINKIAVRFHERPKKATESNAKRFPNGCHHGSVRWAHGFISNNVNSYARILNGPQQLQQIREFNELAANIAALQLEKEELESNVREGKCLLYIAKAERKAEKDRKMQIERDEKGPGCKADVEKGLEHVLSLNNTRRREILRIHYGIIAGVYKMSAPETMAEFRKLMIVDVSIET
jgi:hypothetical protein